MRRHAGAAVLYARGLRAIDFDRRAAQERRSDVRDALAAVPRFQKRESDLLDEIARLQSDNAILRARLGLTKGEPL